MFRASLRPSSGGRNTCHCLWFSVLAVAVVVQGSEMCALSGNILLTVHTSRYPEPRQLEPGQNTIGSDTQFCRPDDGSKDARSMLRNNWLPINHCLLHQVGLAFIWLFAAWDLLLTVVIAVASWVIDKTQEMVVVVLHSPMFWVKRLKVAL